MKRRNLLFVLGLCCCLSIGAQDSQTTGTSGFTRVKSMLKPIDVNKYAQARLGVVMRSGNRIRHNQSDKNNPPMMGQTNFSLKQVKGKDHAINRIGRRASANTEKKERLDSVVATVIGTGEPYSKQTFQYDENGWPVKRVNSTWDTATRTWIPSETYGYKLDSNGYVLSEWVLYSYGYGMRNDYTYNERNLGVSMVSYTSNGDDNWTPSARGEYTYDDRGNIIEEKISNYDTAKQQFIPANWNKAAWDDRGLQILMEPYTWNGTEWVGDEKMEYEWLDAGHMSKALCYTWLPDTKEWFHYISSIFDFNERIQLVRFEKKFWNKSKQDWSGCENYNGGYYQNILDSTFYDSKGRMTYDVAYTGEPTGYVKGADMTYDITESEDGGWTSVCSTRVYPAGEVNDILTEEYNASGILTHQIEKATGYVENKMINLLETQWIYNDSDQLTQQLEYTFTIDEKNERLSNIASFYTYNENGLVSEGMFQNGTAMMGLTSGEDWVNYSKFEYTYEQDTICVSKTKYLWTEGAWTENEKTQIDFDYSVPVEDIVVWPGVLAYHKVNVDEEYTSFNGYTGYAFKFYYTNLQSTQSIAQALSNEGVKIYPIVNEGEFYVDAPAGTQVDVYSMGGVCLKKSTSGRISIQDLQPGVYIVSAGATRTKIVKK